jgi:hypothetical protein
MADREDTTKPLSGETEGTAGTSGDGRSGAPAASAAAAADLTGSAAAESFYSAGAETTHGVTAHAGSTPDAAELLEVMSAAFKTAMAQHEEVLRINRVSVVLTG